MRTLKNSVAILIQNFKLISQIVLTVWFPGTVLIVLLATFVFPSATNGDELASLVQEVRVTNLIELAFGPVYIGALIYALSKIEQGIIPTYQESIQHGVRQCYKLFIARLSAGLLIVLGYIALIIPGIILSLHFAFIDMTVVLDGKQGREARKLSKRLTKKRRWKILGGTTITVVAISLFNTLLVSVLYFPFSLIGIQSNLATDIFAGCICSVTSALINIVLFLYYWDAKKFHAVEQ